MNNKEILKPTEVIQTAIKKCADPWLRINQVPEPFSVEEIVRVSGSTLSARDIKRFIEKGLTINFPNDAPPLQAFLMETKKGKIKVGLRYPTAGNSDNHFETLISLKQSNLAKAIAILEQFDQFGEPICNVAISKMSQSLETDQPLEFIQFTCPRIDAAKLNDPYPQEYIVEDPLGNNFERGGRDLRLNKLLEVFNQKDIPITLSIIIADTDEEDYIFPVLGKPRELREDDCEKRRQKYKENFTVRIMGKFPGWKMSVERLSELILLYDNTLTCVDIDFSNPIIYEGVQLEMEKMRKSFEIGSYYQGLDLPSDKNLKQIVELKFKTYANQGVVLTKFFPNAILIQNEAPFWLRTLMINLGNQDKEKLGVIYPYQERL